MNANRPHCLVLGGGGHAKVVIDALKRMDIAGEIAVLVDDADPAAKDDPGAPVIGGDSFLDIAVDKGFSHFVAAIGDNAVRAAVFKKGVAAGLTPLGVLHPDSMVSDTARLGEGCMVLAGAVINAGAIIGDNVIVNSNAVIEHDCKVADHVHVAPRACLLGGVGVGEAAHIGAGAVVREGLNVGAGAMIGAGAAVVEDIAAGVTAVGVPAKPKT